mgnify:FL=1
MLTNWSEFVAFVNIGIQELVQTEFAQVRFGDVGLAFWLSLVVGAAVVATLARLVFQRRKHSRSHSGYAIDSKHQKRLWVTAVCGVPKAIIGIGIALILVAAADPFLTATEEISTPNHN